ncbi:similar to Saccharomyces cerevisiae YPR133C SPN1 Protein involved in RNA polymerase II transcription [Maudiozyma barnettii]|uniref:Similar to Saccharomyces cerevisiae YPR133C SPN1 Protein involved in RNA polymerase II transcription n=1 Tax=Maudiozyma barnettii TaxID=61262 RepID=A0A8H2ZLE9_9SACH|nr:Spn1p [Kazachstania barnettii]CAB4256072.1 similar to Saccharomyces cerevisiae YPR133C SPN1 Protein involved in RNA polymerase II transcription [Kazachstania barnettii]CAD1784680.1 similar to Saccharomyces cerevisiae YPR133C SPN1 Protein involved in RNA polymerase II transcription [Kazachstania barnettii]
MDTTTKEVEAQQSSGEPTNEAVAPVVENTTGNTTGTTETPIENQQPTERSRKHLSNSDDDDDRKDKDSEDEHDQRIRGISVPDSSGNDTSDFGSTATKRQLLEDKLDRILKKPKVRRTRRDEDDLEQYQDEKILRLKDEMNIAAQLDIDTLNSRIDTGNNSLIAIQKVKLLPKVESILSKANLADTILDNNLLQSVRIWLEPLPDGSLPSFEIQKSLFSAINSLPIKTEHLKESGLGRIMIFYTKSKHVEPQLARIAEKLIAEWTRPIIGASDNYRDKRITQLSFDYDKLRKKSALDSAISGRKKKKPSSTVAQESGSTPQSLYEQAAARRGRAAAPAQTTTDYKFAPVSNVIPVNTNARTTGVGSTLNNNEMYKKLNASLNKNKSKH